MKFKVKFDRVVKYQVTKEVDLDDIEILGLVDEFEGELAQFGGCCESGLERGYLGVCDGECEGGECAREFL